MLSTFIESEAFEVEIMWTDGRALPQAMESIDEPLLNDFIDYSTARTYAPEVEHRLYSR